MLMYSVGVPVWIQVLAVTGCLVMVLSCGSESWTCGLWLWSRIWLEDVLENSRVAVGYKSLSPRYSLSCPLVHYMLFIHPCFCPCLPLTPTTTISTAFIVAPCLSSFFCLVRSPASHAKKRFPWIFPAKLEQVTNNLLFTSLLFTVMVCLLSLETDRNCKFRRWWISVPVWGYTAVDSTSVGIYL